MQSYSLVYDSNTPFLWAIAITAVIAFLRSVDCYGQLRR